jgi:hypothetical protein
MNTLKIIVLLFIFYSNLNAQKNVIKVNPLGLLFNTIPIQYERVNSSRTAIGIDVSFLKHEVTVDNSKKTDIIGIGVEAKYKIGLDSKTSMPRGWYAAPLAGFGFAETTVNNITSGANIINFGLITGYQWIFSEISKGVALDINVGGNYINASTYGSATGISINGLHPRIGVGIGYSF